MPFSMMCSSYLLKNGLTITRKKGNLTTSFTNIIFRMTPEKRLDQLEPVMADMLQKQDLLARKQEQIYQQNRELAKMHFDLVISQSQLSIRLEKVEADVVQLKTDVAQLKTDVAEVNSKLDLVLTLLRNQNGH